MNKSLYALSLLMASSLCAASGASALEMQNGTNLNGLAFNGLAFNGLAFNGTNLNGLAFNGTNLNGLAFNGASREGADLADGMQATTVILKDGAHVVLK